MKDKLLSPKSHKIELHPHGGKRLERAVKPAARTDPQTVGKPVAHRLRKTRSGEDASRRGEVTGSRAGTAEVNTVERKTKSPPPSLVQKTRQKRSEQACAFFVSASAPCTVFQTTTDSGSTWTRHGVPVPPDSTGQVLVAADPTRAGTYTVAALNSSGGQFLVYVTHDSGDSWTGPATIAGNPNTTKFKTWINYSDATGPSV
jgi:hypothetical protein